METFDLKSFIERWLYDPTVGKIVFTVIGILVIIIFVRFSKKHLSRYIKDTDSRYRLRKFVSFLGYFLGFLFIITVFSERLGDVHVAFGIAGAGIAFSLQKVIVSIAGWIAVSFGNFYRTGDRVQFGGVKGDVIDIGILRTTLMECGQWVNADQYTGRIVRISNSFVFEEPVFNYSGDFPFLWDEITVPIKYGSDYQLAREILYRVAQKVVGDYVGLAKKSWEEIVNKYLIEPESVEPRVTLIANDNWMEFTLRYVIDYKKRRITKDQLFTEILGELDKTGGRVALASSTFHLVEAPVFDVRISDKTKEPEK